MPFEITRTELVWPGKYDEEGNLVQVERVNLSFQVIEDYPDNTLYRSCLVFARTRARAASSRRLCSRAGRGQGHHHHRLRARPGSLD